MKSNLAVSAGQSVIEHELERDGIPISESPLHASYLGIRSRS